MAEAKDFSISSLHPERKVNGRLSSRALKELGRISFQSDNVESTIEAAKQRADRATLGFYAGVAAVGLLTDPDNLDGNALHFSRIYETTLQALSELESQETDTPLT